jgi:pyruvate kinase
MHTTKRTKIVCTIGPSSWDPNILRQMFESGMNIARVNGAFADVPELKRVGDMIRNISPDIALMLDIKGHEVRLNKFEEKIHIKPGDEFVLGSCSDDAVYPITYPDLYKDLTPGQPIILDKGNAQLEVLRIENNKIICKVIQGEVIESGKGMNLPGSKLHNPSLTKIDKEQIEYVVGAQWDFIAGSFIRSANDIEDIKKVTGDSEIKIIAKIEDQQGVDNINDIIAASYGIMIARGDMGTEMPFEKLPIIQKELIYKCNKAGKPVITATNMLESMIEKSMPTRAEITDVANAVLDGTDAIMTSGETSSGKYPVETIITMTKIALESEQYLVPEIIETLNLDDHKISVAMANAAFEFIAQVPEITKVIVYSKTGLFPRLISRLNLPVEIFTFVSNDTLKRQLSMTKNVTAFVFNGNFQDRDKAVKGIINFGIEGGTMTANDKILLIGNLDISNDGAYNHSNIFEYIDISKALDK